MRRVPPVPSRLDRALDQAGEILAWEASAVLYALVVLGPLALLALAAWLDPPRPAPPRGGPAARRLDAEPG